MTSSTAESDATTCLVHGREAIEAGNFAAAIGPLVRVWRQTRSEAVAELVMTVDARLARTEIQGRRVADRQATWLGIAAQERSADLPTLLHHLMNARAAAALERLDALASWPADPRVARVLVQAMTDPPFTAISSAPFWKRAGTLLVKHADRGVLARLEGEASYEDTLGLVTLGRLLDRVVAKAADEVRQMLENARGLTPEEECTITQIGARLQPRGRLTAAHPSDLLAAIHEDPTNDEPRRVYADALLDRDDPHGELIQLQLIAAQLEREGRPVPANNSRRQRQLVEQHAATWVGSAHKLFHKRSLWFDRGFLAACSLRRVVPDQGPVLRAFEDATRLVRHIDLDGRNTMPGVGRRAFVSRLSALSGLHSTSLPDVCGTTVRLPRLTALGLEIVVVSDELIEQLSVADGLPSLRHLYVAPLFNDDDLRVRELEWLLESPLGERLESFAIKCGTKAAAARARDAFARWNHSPFARLFIQHPRGVVRFERSATLGWTEHTMPNVPLTHWWAHDRS